MKKARFVHFGWMVGLALACSAYAAMEADVSGLWNGQWEGGGAGGRFDLTLTKTGDVLSGKVDVGQDTGDYTAVFTVVTLEDGKFKARYDYPPEPQAEIVLDGKMDDVQAAGGWTMVQKGGTDAFAAGSWTVKKQ